MMCEGGSLLFIITIFCSVLDVKSHLSYQHALNQLETAVLDSTHTMHQLEVLASSLLATDLCMGCALDNHVHVSYVGE